MEPMCLHTYVRPATIESFKELNLAWTGHNHTARHSLSPGVSTFSNLVPYCLCLDLFMKMYYLQQAVTKRCETTRENIVEHTAVDAECSTLIVSDGALRLDTRRHFPLAQRHRSMARDRRRGSRCTCDTPGWVETIDTLLFSQVVTPKLDLSVRPSWRPLFLQIDIAAHTAILYICIYAPTTR